MTRLNILEVAMISVVLGLLFLTVVDYTYSLYHHEWKPRQCVYPNGTVASCPYDMGGMPSVPEHVSMNWSVQQ